MSETLQNTQVDDEDLAVDMAYIEKPGRDSAAIDLAEAHRIEEKIESFGESGEEEGVTQREADYLRRAAEKSINDGIKAAERLEEEANEVAYQAEQAILPELEDQERQDDDDQDEDPLEGDVDRWVSADETRTDEQIDHDDRYRVDPY